MTTSRENSAGSGAHEYTEGRYTITLMGDGFWQIFSRDDKGVLHDQGQDFKTLRAARGWCKNNA